MENELGDTRLNTVAVADAYLRSIHCVTPSPTARNRVQEADSDAATFLQNDCGGARRAAAGARTEGGGGGGGAGGSVAAAAIRAERVVGGAVSHSRRAGEAAAAAVALVRTEARAGRAASEGAALAQWQWVAMLRA